MLILQEKHSFHHKTSNSFMDQPATFKHFSRMEKIDLQRLGAVLREARRAKGLGLKDIASVAGVSAQAVGQWERGENGPAMAKLIAVGKLLEIDVSAAMQGKVAAKPNPAAAPAEVVHVPGPAYPDFGEYDIEVRGVAVGGKDSDFVFAGETRGRVRRPPGIRYAKGVEALYVIGESMSPKFEPGDLIYCQRVPPSPGDDIIIEMYPDDGDGADSSAPAGKGFIKRLISRTGSRLTCRQFNPERSNIVFDAGEIKAVYRVIPLKELMG